MAEYRVGNVAGFPLPGVWQGAAIVAVVVNGDTALAERICALLNADGPTCVHGSGKRCGPCSFDRAIPPGAPAHGTGR